MNGCVRVAAFTPDQATLTLNRWILGECGAAAGAVTAALEAFKFNEAAGAAYRFVWNLFCDWYLELAKPVLQGEDGPAKDETRATIAFVLDEICKLLHPFMPFLTEELWAIKGEEGPARETLLAPASWPETKAAGAAEAEAEIGWITDLVSDIRSARAEPNVPARAQGPLVLVATSAQTRARVARWEDVLRRLARLGDISYAEAVPGGSIQLIVRGEVAALPLAGLVDLAAERVRLEKELGKLDADIARIDA